MRDLSFAKIDLALVLVINLYIQPAVGIATPAIALRSLYLNRLGSQVLVTYQQVVLRNVSCERSGYEATPCQFGTAKVFTYLPDELV